MKKTAFLAVFVLISTFSYSQFHFGGGISYGFDIEQPALTAKGVLIINKQFRFSPSLSYFFPTTETVNRNAGLTVQRTTRFLTLNGDLHYKIPLRRSKGFGLYPLIGVNLSFFDVEEKTDVNFPGNLVDESDVNLGLNVGFGANVAITHRLHGFTEIKVVTGDSGQGVLGIGVLYEL